MGGPVIRSVGHGTRPIAEFLELLRGAGIRHLVDVRSSPSSKKWPWFAREALAAALETAGIGYAWEGPGLGGFRKTHPGSRHTALTSPGFRGYADHMASEEFLAALRRLVEAARTMPTAFMCAESMWWRCHRRLLSDALLVAGCEVRHLLPDGRQEIHRLHTAARVVDGRLVYDVGQAPRLDLD